jgi:uncharacterized protein
MALLWGDFDEIGEAVIVALDQISAHKKSSAGVRPSSPPGSTPVERSLQRTVAARPVLPADAPQGGISAPQQRILDSLEWLLNVDIDTPSRAQVAALAGQSPRSSGYSNNLSSLKTAGLIAYGPQSTLSISDAGRHKAEAPSSQLTGADVQERARDLVSTPQWAIPTALLAARDLSREECATQSSQSATSSGYSNNLSALRSMGFLDYSAPGRIRAADILFI